MTTTLRNAALQQLLRERERCNKSLLDLRTMARGLGLNPLDQANYLGLLGRLNEVQARLSKQLVRG